MDWWRAVDQDLTEVPHAVVGAIAANAYMAPRATVDLDLSIHADDREHARELLIDRGYQHRGALLRANDPRASGDRWTTPDGEDLDLISMGHRWARRAITEAQDNRRSEANGLPVLPVPYLVLMKTISSRTTDNFDIQRMLGAASEKDWQRTRELIRQHHPQDLEDMDALRQIGLWERADPYDQTDPGPEGGGSKR